MKSAETGYWTHPSVRPFARIGDPIAVIAERANRLGLDAIEQGWSGPPFDTFQLAELLGISIIPCESVRDARLVAVPRNRYRIEYNPNQPKARMLFSIAHEIAHTLFPDCRESARYRATKGDLVDDDWQLEMLCNVGAAELLMPMGSFAEIGESNLSIDLLLRMRERFQVSTEAVLIRSVRLSRVPCAIFAASSQFSEPTSSRIDYVRSANDWNISLSSGFKIPKKSVVYDCRAIGHTAKGDETWDEKVGPIHVECIAVPSYRGSGNPRILGLLLPAQSQVAPFPRINYLIGDATEPRGGGPTIIAHVVNNATPRWGGGFARVIRNHWPEAQSDFINWTALDRSRLRLGNHHLFQADNELSIFHMIAQHGYGKSDLPRVRYHHLESCLAELATIAKRQSATVHMPRIGCGQAGGNWSVVSELIDSILCRHGIEVTVYDLPSERERWMRPEQVRTLFDDPDIK